MAQLADLVNGVGTFGESLKPNDAQEVRMQQQAESASVLRASLDAIGESVSRQKQAYISITNTPSAEFAQVPVDSLVQCNQHDT